MKIKTDVVIVGCGVSGLYLALQLPKDFDITIITKSDMKSSDSFLAQGGICVMKEEADYESYFEDTMRAGHYENRKESVDIMLRSSGQVIHTLIGYGVDFEREADGSLKYTREGAHSRPRILFHQDITGEEITSKLLMQVQRLSNVRVLEYTSMIDIVEQDNCCRGVLCVHTGAPLPGADGAGDMDTSYERVEIEAAYTVLASGGIGGIYRHSTNFRHLTGDALAICKRHGVRLQDVDYVQIHPTTFYSNVPGRRFLISESVRGEGAVLYNAKGERFVNELQPRDVVTRAVREQMEKDKTEYVMLSMEHIDKDDILGHFPNIYKRCMEEGYDVTKEPIPVVPAQHYFMGGIYVDSDSKTTMERLYAVGETSCNGVHGANRLASNSLLESMVFAARAAEHIKRRQTALQAQEAAEHIKRRQAALQAQEAGKQQKPSAGQELLCAQAKQDGAGENTVLSAEYIAARQKTAPEVEAVKNEVSYRALADEYKAIIWDEIERMRAQRERSAK